MSGPNSENLSLLTAEAFGAFERARRQCGALGATLDQAGNALNVAGLPDLCRQLEKLIELHRLVSVRVDVLAKRVGEGGV